MNHKLMIMIAISIVFLINFSLASSLFPYLQSDTNRVCAEAVDSQFAWNTSLIITSTDGSGFTLSFGESTDASDDVDQYDTPVPPSPPQLPHINARFLTDFDPPNQELLQEIKQYPDTNKTWEFSVIWFAGPGNTSTTTITIQWENADLKQSEYTSIQLKENNTFVKNMLTSNSYTFDTTSNQPSFFSIVCAQGNSTISDQDPDDNQSGNNTPFLSLTVILSMFFIIALVLYIRKNDNS